MSLGILSGGSTLSGALGVDSSPPKPWCWKAAGYPWGAAFDACHASSWKTCDAGRRYEALANKIWTTEQFENCVNLRDNTDCSCPAANPAGSSPAASSAAALTMGNKTSNPRVVELQKAINSVLTKNGYAAISTDGKLGPGTCGAAREADKFGTTLMTQYGLAGVCTSFTTPNKLTSGSSSFSSGGNVSTASLVPESQGLFGLSTQTLIIGGAVALGLYVFLGDKKKAKAA